MTRSSISPTADIADGVAEEKIGRNSRTTRLW
jgi:hypothetical protein